MEFIDLKKQYALYKEGIDREVSEVLASGCYIMGPKIAEVEEKLARFAGVKHCITVSSGTDSLLIALMALGVGAGDEVITTPFSWVSTIEVILLLGAKPVLVDIERDSFNIDPRLIEERITKRTKAIIPVSLFGQMADLVAINAIADRYGIPVIEDGAQSFGAQQSGKKCCGASTIGSTSFFPTKTLGCAGDGGALFTDDDNLAYKMRAIRTHGGVVRDQHETLGLNGRFDSLQAAILLAKLPYFEKELEMRQEVGLRYNALLKECGIQIPVVKPGNHHVYGVYTIRLEERDQVIHELEKEKIPSRVYYPKCFHQIEIFAQNEVFPEADRATREVLSLPMHPWIEAKDQEKIARLLEKFTMAGL